jgi:hypothetical protein
MPVGRLNTRETERLIREVLSWDETYFAQRYEVEPREHFGNGVWSLSDPEVLAAALSGLVARLGVTDLVASTEAWDDSIDYSDEGEEIVDKIGRELAWRREEVMAARMPPDRVAELHALFREAGVRRGYWGGIVASGRDCPRVAKLLANYAYDMPVENVWFRCGDRPLAFLACHEGDLHVYSQEKALIDTCKKILKRFGVTPCPGASRLPEEWMRQGVVSYGGTVRGLIFGQSSSPATAAEERERRRFLKQATREVTDPSPHKRAFAAHVLSLLGEKEHLDLVFRAMEDPDAEVREAARRGMARR